MANKARETLEKRVRNAILQEAFFRPESALVISLAMLLTAFAPNFIQFIPAWAWLVGGAVAEGILVYSSLSDPEFGRKVAADLLRNQFRPERLNDKALQQQITEALDYRDRIEDAIREQKNSLIRDELIQTAGQIDDWLANMYDLAQRIDRYRQKRKILERDRSRAATRIRELEQNLALETNPAVQQQIQLTLDSMRRQLETLETLENTIQRAELQLENSLSHLGTIYSQTILVDAKDIDSGRSRRLRQEISDEVSELNDILIAMDEVYSAESAI